MGVPPIHGRTPATAGGGLEKAARGNGDARFAADRAANSTS
jgi:hypothetical protein